MDCPTSFSSLESAWLCCREGVTKWENLNLDDIDVRMKWAGMFHRRKRTPGKFMMRLKVSMASHQQTASIYYCEGRATDDLA